MTPDFGTVTTILESLSQNITGGYSRILADINWLLQTLVAIELTLFGLVWMAQREMAIKTGLWKILNISFVIFIITNYPALTNALAKGFLYFGLKASGDNLSMQDLLNPSLIAGYGIELVAPILTKLTLWDTSRMVITGFCAMVIMFCFFIIAIEIFITFLQFYIVALLALVLLPFRVLKPASFMGEKALWAVISYGVKLMTMAFVMGVISPVLASIDPPASSMKYAEIFALLFVAMAFMMLVWQVPKMATNLLSGIPPNCTHSQCTATAPEVLVGQKPTAQTAQHFQRL